MCGILNAVQAGASSVLTTLGELGADIAFGVRNYQDFASGDPYAFPHEVSPDQCEGDHNRGDQFRVGHWRRTPFVGPATRAQQPGRSCRRSDRLARPPLLASMTTRSLKRRVMWRSADRRVAARAGNDH